MGRRATEILTKQEHESLLIHFDFGEELAPTESIAQCSGTVASPTSITIGPPQVSGDSVQVRVSGGTSTINYVLTCTVVTTAGNIFEGQGVLIVE
jgi:hypothetical protein